MKKALLIGVAMLLVASAVNADGPAQGYIGLYADGIHSVCNVMNPAGAFMPFTMWIWCLPSSHGMTAAEFAISFPGTVIASTITVNPLITVGLGTLTGGTSVAFGACNNDWVWTHQVACYSIAALPAIIEVIPDPTAQPPAYQFATCELGNPLEAIFRLTHLYLNQQCVYATKDASWGAIKSLF